MRLVHRRRLLLRKAAEQVGSSLQLTAAAEGSCPRRVAGAAVQQAEDSKGTRGGLLVSVPVALSGRGVRTALRLVDHLDAMYLAV